MRSDPTSNHRSARGVAALGAVALALAATGCASRQSPALVLPPAPTVTTAAARPVPASPTRRTSTTAARVPATTTTAPAAAAPVVAAPVAPAASAARPAGRVGSPRSAVPATTAAPEPATTVPVSTTRVAGPVPVSVAGAGPTSTAPTVSGRSLQITAPSGRAVPEGPFDVLVAGATDYALTAQPAAVCAVDGGRVVPVGAGECRIRAAADGATPAEAVVRLRRGDQAVTWQLGGTTTFTYNTLALDLRATSGAPVRLVDARGACKLAGATALSFVVVGGSGMPVLGQCDVTAAVDESPGWNAATITLTTTTVRAPVTLALDVPASSTLPTFTARVTMTQGDRSLDNLLAFSVESAGACSLGASASLVNPSTRTATLKVTGSAPASGWCALRVLTDVGGAAGLVNFSTPGCRFVWIGTGTPPAAKPTCPW